MPDATHAPVPMPFVQEASKRLAAALRHARTPEVEDEIDAMDGMIDALVYGEEACDA